MRPLSVVLFLAVPLAGAVACGTSATNPRIPRGEPLPESAAPSASASSAPVEIAPRPPNEKNVSLRPSALSASLSAIGLDAKHLVPLASMSLDQKKKLMPLFVQSLGYGAKGDGASGCTGCHTADFKAETTNKAIARQMYDRWSVGLEVEGGGAVFCDSCHDGRAKVIDRSDTPALKAFMKAEYQDKLQAHDGAGASCATCHGTDLEIAIFEKVWKVPMPPSAEPIAPPPTKEAAPPEAPPKKKSGKKHKK